MHISWGTSTCCWPVHRQDLETLVHSQIRIGIELKKCGRVHNFSWDDMQCMIQSSPRPLSALSFGPAFFNCHPLDITIGVFYEVESCHCKEPMSVSQTHSQIHSPDHARVVTIFKLAIGDKPHIGLLQLTCVDHAQHTSHGSTGFCC